MSEPVDRAPVVVELPQQVEEAADLVLEPCGGTPSFAGVGLQIANAIAAACYGTRGELRPRVEREQQ